MANNLNQTRPKRGGGSLGTSPTAGFDRIGSNFNALGTPVPIVLGEHRVEGIQVHSNTVREGQKGVFKGVFVMSEGPVAEIKDIQIEGSPTSEFDTLQVSKQLGGNTNDPVPFIERNVVEVLSTSFDLSESNYPNNPEDATVFAPDNPGAIKIGDYVNFTFTFPDGLFKRIPIILSGSSLVRDARALFKVESQSKDGTWETETNSVDDALDNKVLGKVSVGRNQEVFIAGTNPTTKKIFSLSREADRKTGMVLSLPVQINNTTWGDERKVRIRRYWQAWQRGSDNIVTIGQSATTARLTEVSWERPNDFTYGNCAVLGVKIDLEEVGSPFPNVSAVVKGLVEGQGNNVTIDDFEDQDISEYGTGNFAISSNAEWNVRNFAHDGDYSLRADYEGPEDTFAEDLTGTGLDNTPSQGDVFNGWMYSELDDETGATWMYIIFAADPDNDDYYRIGLKSTEASSDDTFKIEKIDNGTVVKSDSTTFVGQGFDSWYQYEIDWSDPTISADINDAGGSTFETVSIDDTDYTSGDFGHAIGAEEGDDRSATTTTTTTENNTLDDFEDGDLAGWSTVESSDDGFTDDKSNHITWTNQQNDVQEGNNAVEGEIDKPSNDDDKYQHEYFVSDGFSETPSRGDQIKFWLKYRRDPGDEIKHAALHFGWGGTDSSYSLRWDLFDGSTDPNWGAITNFELRGNGTNDFVSDEYDTDDSGNEDKWFEVTIDWDNDNVNNDGDIKATIDDANGNNLTTLTINNTEIDSGDIALEIQGSGVESDPMVVEGFWDDIRFETTTESETTVAIPPPDPDATFYFDTHEIEGSTTHSTNRIDLIHKAATMPEDEGGFGLSDSIFDSANEDNAASYLDEQVDDGEGGTEKRDVVDFVIDTELTFDEFMDQMTAIPHLEWYGDESGVRYYLDKSGKSPQNLFTRRNIVQNDDGGTTLNVDPKSREEQFNSLSVEFLNRSLNYGRDVVEVQWGGASSDIPQDKVNLVGVTRRSQVKRDAQLMLRTMNKEDFTYQFETGLSGINVQPGDVCWIAHDIIPTTQGTLSGQVRDYGDDWVSTDREIDMEAGKDYKLTVRLQDGTVKKMDIVNEEKQTNIFTLETETFTNLGSDPVDEGPVTVGIDGEANKEIRIEETTENDDGTMTIVATEHDETKYSGVNDIDISPLEPEKKNNNTAPQPVENLSAQLITSPDADNLEDRRKIKLDWDVPEKNAGNVDRYIIWSNDTQAAKDQANFQRLGSTELSNFSTPLFIDGNETQFVVQTVMQDKRVLDFADSPLVSIQTTGLRNESPNDTSGLTAKETKDGIELDWDAVDDASFDHFEVRLGASWENARVLADDVNDSFFLYSEELTNTKYHFLVKSISATGTPSNNADSTTITIGEEGTVDEIHSVDEQNRGSGWPGTITDGEVVTRNGDEVIVPDHIANNVAKVDSFSYETNSIDITRDWTPVINVIWNVNIPARNGPNWDNLWSTNEVWTDNEPDNPYTWRDYENHPGTTVEYEAIKSGGSFSGNWVEFTGPVDTTEFKEIKFRITIEVNGENDELQLRQFHPLITTPEVRIGPDTDSGLDQISLSSSGTTITFSNYTDQRGETADYFEAPTTINVDTFSDSSVVRYTVSNLTDTSVDIKPVDSSGNGVSSDANVNITGY